MREESSRLLPITMEASSTYSVRTYLESSRALVVKRKK